MKKETIGIILFLIIIIISSCICINYPCFKNSLDGTAEFNIKLKSFLEGFGVLAPFALIFILALQVVLAPLPGQFFGLASGYIYGPWLGTILSIIGLTIGSAIAFYLGRRFGRPLIERIIRKKNLKKFDYLANKRGSITIFMLFLLPVFPDDAICFIGGLTKIPIPNLIILAIIGRLPGFLMLNFMGAGVAYQNLDLSIILFTLLMVLSGITYIYRENIEEKLHQIVSR
ncbi:MAG: TVP38/TMEM64 family protein [Nanobdellota archaeon]